MFELLGTPDESKWPGCSELYFLKQFKQRPQPFNRLRDRFRGRATSFTSATSLSESGLDLLGRMLTLNPADRITAGEATRHRYFGEEPRPKDHCLMPTFPSTFKAH
jgi:serine/threonine protein kinase